MDRLSLFHLINCIKIAKLKAMSSSIICLSWYFVSTNQTWWKKLRSMGHVTLEGSQFLKPENHVCEVFCTKMYDLGHSEVIATWLATFGGCECAIWWDEEARPCGLMDKAPDFGSGDCRFESCHGRFLFHLISSHFLQRSAVDYPLVLFWWDT